MGQQQSKGELLYQQVNCGNIEGIKSLVREGANLEWNDRERKTPLILASLNPELYNVAKTLIELGANVNAFRPGRHGGTPLHHAAKRGLESTVKLLLSNGANALILNDDCQTPLDIARAKGHSNAVRAIESYICLFSGWMREFYGPGLVEMLAPQLISRKVWVVIVPCGSRNSSKPSMLELAIYSNLQEAQPRFTIALWKANLDESKFHLPDPSVTIIAKRGRRRRQRHNIYNSQEVRCRRRTRRQTCLKLGPGNENDKQQFKWFCDACKGIPQAMHPAFMHNHQTLLPATAPPASEDLELSMAISASIQSAMHETPPVVDTYYQSSEASSSKSVNISGGQCAPSSDALPTTSSHSFSAQLDQILNSDAIVQSTSAQKSFPCEPPIADKIVGDGPIHYPSIDSSPVGVPSSATEAEEGKCGGSESSCVICLDAPTEGACVPCGHVAGCMSCLNEIKAKKWGCPLCRAKVDHVIKLYHI